MFSMLFMVAVGYLCLLRDLVPPCIESLAQIRLSPAQHSLAMLGSALLALPLCLAANLDALR